MTEEDVEYCFQRSGDNRPIPGTISSICATNTYLHNKTEYMKTRRIVYKKIAGKRVGGYGRGEALFSRASEKRRLSLLVLRGSQKISLALESSGEAWKAIIAWELFSVTESEFLLGFQVDSSRVASEEVEGTFYCPTWSKTRFRIIERYSLTTGSDVYADDVNKVISCWVFSNSFLSLCAEKVASAIFKRFDSILLLWSYAFARFCPIGRLNFSVSPTCSSSSSLCSSDDLLLFSEDVE